MMANASNAAVAIHYFIASCALCTSWHVVLGPLFLVSGKVCGRRDEFVDVKRITF